MRFFEITSADWFLQNNIAYNISTSDKLSSCMMKKMAHFTIFQIALSELFDWNQLYIIYLTYTWLHYLIRKNDNSRIDAAA